MLVNVKSEIKILKKNHTYLCLLIVYTNYRNYILIIRLSSNVLYLKSTVFLVEPRKLYKCQSAKKDFVHYAMVNDSRLRV